jgi:hypothetical protein
MQFVTTLEWVGKLVWSLSNSWSRSRRIPLQQQLCKHRADAAEMCCAPSPLHFHLQWTPVKLPLTLCQTGLFFGFCKMQWTVTERCSFRGATAAPVMWVICKKTRIRRETCLLLCNVSLCCWVMQRHLLNKRCSVLLEGGWYFPKLAFTVLHSSCIYFIWDILHSTD